MSDLTLIDSRAYPTLAASSWMFQAGAALSRPISASATRRANSSPLGEVSASQAKGAAEEPGIGFKVAKAST